MDKNNPLPLDPAKAAARDALSRMIGRVEPFDVLALAHALAPLPTNANEASSRGRQPRGLLRQAIDASLSGEPKSFDLAQLESLARVDPRGPQTAWSLACAEGEPLPAALADGLARARDDATLDGALIEKLLELIDPKALAQARSSSGASLGRLLAARSKVASFGCAPALAWAARSDFDFVHGSFASARGGEPERAIFALEDPKAWDWFLAHGGSPDEEVEGRPLWEAWRLRASRGSGELAKVLEDWSNANRANAQEARKLAEYFVQLSRYGGGESLRKRKDWAELRDAEGRTVMMALACNPSEIRSYWEVKKALPAVASKDPQGRSLWHYLMAQGSSAITGTASFLAKHCPMALDSQGRGLIPSVQAMPIGSSIGQRSSGFAHLKRHELERAADKIPDARLWLACPDPMEAKAFGHWLAHGLHVSAKDWGSPDFDDLAQFAIRLDPTTFAGVDPHVCAGLAVAICMSRGDDPQKVNAVSALMARGGYLEIDSGREAIMRVRAPKACLAAFDEVQGPLREAMELRAAVEDQKRPAPTSSAPLRV